jgi:GT2 family glycosyltransferase
LDPPGADWRQETGSIRRNLMSVGATVEPTARPTISIIVNNYNGAAWLERCLSSLRAQTIFNELEIIVADDASPDKSADLADALLAGVPNACVIHNKTNLGYCELNNAAVKSVRGKYVFFVNNDAWLEPDCVEKLVREVEAAGATTAAPLILNYVDDTVLTASEDGFDIFGLISPNYGPGYERAPRTEGASDTMGTSGSQKRWARTHEVLMAAGCAVFILTDRFRELGGFDSELRVFADEYDLCWRDWIAGGKVIVVPSARMHHRSMTGVNPQGRQEITEWRTSDTKRFLANRNNLLVLLKNAQHLLLLMLPLQLLLLIVETSFMALLTGRWSHVKRAFFDALRDCWRLRGHIRAERRRIGKLRRRGDFWMLRFLRLEPNRWGDLRRFWHYRGLKVDTK